MPSLLRPAAALLAPCPATRTGPPHPKPLMKSNIYTVCQLLDGFSRRW